MATPQPTPAQQLAERHRLAQLQLRAALLRSLLRVWRTLDKRNLDITFDRWFALVWQEISQHRGYSAAIAARYVQDIRRQAGNGGLAPVVPIRQLPVEKAQLAMRVTAVRAVKQATAKKTPLREASNIGFVRSAGEATQMALDAGRDTVLDMVAADPVALGWARITDGNPCAFCAMLASRGAHYKSQESASFQAHPHCGCSAVAIYDRRDAQLEMNRQFATEWRKATRGVPSAEKLNAYRRYRDGRK